MTDKPTAAYLFAREASGAFSFFNGGNWDMDGFRMFDAHCDTVYYCDMHGISMRKTGGALDFGRLSAHLPGAQFFALFGEEEIRAGAAGWDVFLRQYRLFRTEVERNHDLVRFCTDAEQLKRSIRDGRCAAFLSVEGGGMLECSLEKLRRAHAMGVRAVNLTWNFANALSGSCMEETRRGLSALGREFVREMDALGMFADCSHLSEPGFWDVLEETKGPMFASHSNARAVCDHVRNLTDEQIQAIARRGGVIGLTVCATFLGEPPNVGAFAAHLDRVLSLGGEKTAALGGDWDGTMCYMDGISGIQDMERLFEELLRRNYPEHLLRDVFYFNMERMIQNLPAIELK